MGSGLLYGLEVWIMIRKLKEIGMSNREMVNEFDVFVIAHSNLPIFGH